ncbi:MAG: hypothetical protein ABS876_06210 [Ruminococcus sp.]
MFRVKKRTLLLIAGIVWLTAGINVARLGVLSYLSIEQRWYWYLLSIVIFLLFGAMFFRMSQKHTKRIMGYEDERQLFLRFFDLKAYIIMAIMMGGGIGLRAAGVFPDQFVAFFYTGLGSALALAGVLFMKNYIRFERIRQQ